jgi:acetylglutamate kinase
MIMSVRRPIRPVNFGYVGDVKYVNSNALETLLEVGAVPVLAPLTHDREGTMLNTNADTIASSVAMAMSSVYDVTLTFCSSTPGVLRDVNDPSSVIPTITSSAFEPMVTDGTISEGMIPKLQNAFEAINSGVSRVVITSASALSSGTAIIPDPETED